MDFRLSDDQIEFKQLAIDFARKALNEGCAEREDRAEFNREGWRKCAEFGLQGLAMPEKYGGLGLGYLARTIVLEELARVCAAVLASSISLPSVSMRFALPR